MKFTPPYAADLERKALENGGQIIRKPVRTEACAEPVETRMSWTEKQFQAAVIEEAERLGWGKIYHAWMSIRSAPGFPDLVLTRERIVFIELKRQKGKEKPAQKEWREALLAAGGEAYLFRPSQWEEIVATLAR